MTIKRRTTFGFGLFALFSTGFTVIRLVLVNPHLSHAWWLTAMIVGATISAMAVGWLARVLYEQWLGVDQALNRALAELRQLNEAAAQRIRAEAREAAAEQGRW